MSLPASKKHFLAQAQYPATSHAIDLYGSSNIDDLHFPARAVVGFPMYALHNHPAYFPSPFTFDPAR
ncbi:hypothetical protein BDU57DRAFT_516837 [Ampelomyces quisqualis]|uniref:Uncharacterized protein n=1 Tax=Ampelomyces quisqualis TaxID=50730 RepID=A0A6A5QMG2_AMPQU|nr:hypothetical protein BDU57DRAFT_516837 [Ampelomyces quisqualis]